jgi:predicted Zn-dependent peptidase
MAHEPTDLRDVTLPNGVRVVVEPMPWLATATAVLQLPFGTVGDPERARGAALVLHEWLQRGAGGRDARQQADAFDRFGVRRGGGCGRETATLSAAFLVQDVAEVLPLLADAVRAPALADAEFDGARALALQELAGLDDAPAQRLAESVVRARYASAHGRSAYGDRAELEALTPEALRGDARARLGPAGAVLAIAGGGDPDRLLDVARGAFEGWTGATRPHPRPDVRPAHRTHVDGPGAQTQIGVTDDAVAPGAEGWMEQALAMAVLSGAMGARLPTEVRERRGLVYTVASSVRSVRGDAYRFTYASTTPERAAETVEVVVHELNRWRAGVEEDELERARTLLRSNLVMQAESSGGRASRLAADVEAFGRPRPLREVEAALVGTDLDAVNAFLATRPELAPTIVTSGPVPRAWEAVA